MEEISVRDIVNIFHFNSSLQTLAAYGNNWFAKYYHSQRGYLGKSSTIFKFIELKDY